MGRRNSRILPTLNDQSAIQSFMPFIVSTRMPLQTQFPEDEEMSSSFNSSTGDEDEDEDDEDEEIFQNFEK